MFFKQADLFFKGFMRIYDICQIYLRVFVCMYKSSFKWEKFVRQDYNRLSTSTTGLAVNFEILLSRSSFHDPWLYLGYLFTFSDNFQLHVEVFELYWFSSKSKLELNLWFKILVASVIKIVSKHY